MKYLTMLALGAILLSTTTPTLANHFSGQSSLGTTPGSQGLRAENYDANAKTSKNLANSWGYTALVAVGDWVQNLMNTTWNWGRYTYPIGDSNGDGRMSAREMRIDRDLRTGNQNGIIEAKELSRAQGMPGF